MEFIVTVMNYKHVARYYIGITNFIQINRGASVYVFYYQCNKIISFCNFIPSGFQVPFLIRLSKWE